MPLNPSGPSLRLTPMTAMQNKAVLRVHSGAISHFLCSGDDDPSTHSPSKTVDFRVLLNLIGAQYGGKIHKKRLPFRKVRLINERSGMSALKITVIGAGSVGLAVAASLAIAGQKVALAARKGSVVALQDSAITLSGMLGLHEVPAGQITIVDAAAPSQAARDCDMLIVTTKAHGVATALAPFAAPGPKPKAVLSL